MRLIAWLLLAALAIVTGLYPGVAVAAGALLAAIVGLAVNGALLLLAQPAILTAVCVTLVAVSVKRRRLA